jgi:methylated-DNA-protein-cysteine methyltransferase-like protein
MSNYYEDVYAIVRRIPHGKVSTYGRIAQMTPVPRGARGVGWALAGLHPNRASEVPWWRVINAAGRVSNEFSVSCLRPKELYSIIVVMLTYSGFYGMERIYKAS